MKILMFLVSSLLFSISAFSQQWSYTNTTWIGDRYDDVYFHSKDTGWAVHGDGKIFKTVDGGNSWSQLYDNPDLYFRSVEFLNEDIGFAGTLDSVLLKTTDGGTNWTTIEHLIPTAIPGICGLSHVGDNVYGVGLFAHPAYFIKSIDQGQTWTYTDLSAFADGLVECHFIDENVGFVAGIKENSGGIILKTIDGGDNWSVVLNTQTGSEYIWKLDFVTDQVAYGSVESFTGNVASIVKTTDGGDNWIILQVDTIFLDLQGIGFIDQDTGWVSPRNTSMYKTIDGGITWNKTNLYPNINRFFRVDSTIMYAAGMTVYKYDDPTVTTQRILNYKHSHSISSVQPNPFFNNAQFSITIDNRTTARLDLFNALGQHIKNFHTGRINEGSYHFYLNSQKDEILSTGLYYIVLRTSEGFVSVPVIKGKVD